jgi:hypothetical protein
VRESTYSSACDRFNAFVVSYYFGLFLVAVSLLKYLACISV